MGRAWRRIWIEEQKGPTEELSTARAPSAFTRNNSASTTSVSRATNSSEWRKLNQQPPA